MEKQGKQRNQKSREAGNAKKRFKTEKRRSRKAEFCKKKKLNLI